MVFDMKPVAVDETQEPPGQDVCFVILKVIHASEALNYPALKVRCILCRSVFTAFVLMSIFHS